MQELCDRIADQLEAGDGEEADDDERAERFELVVAVRMIFVGSDRGESDQRNRDHVVHGVERRLHRRAEHRERAGAHRHHDFHRDDHEVRDEDDRQRALDLANSQSAASSRAPFRYPVSGIVMTSGWSSGWAVMARRTMRRPAAPAAS